MVSLGSPRVLWGAGTEPLGGVLCSGMVEEMLPWLLGTAGPWLRAAPALVPEKRFVFPGSLSAAGLAARPMGLLPCFADAAGVRR